MQVDAEPVTLPPPAPPLPSTPPADEPRKKKKKKRKREMENGEKVGEERECAASYLEASTQEEDWCQAGMWSLTPKANVGQSEEKPERVQAASAENPEQNEPGQDSLKKKKKKKKMKMMQELQNSSSAASVSERWVEQMIITDLKWNSC